ncbi:MAG: hypothetical protein K2X77_27925 [Candidatus Obscuribacterales bacterium]|jgi:hypothetical protein|nr:hypothetical protein [Candidatus Obscuribacterales bacterium]
MNTKIINFKNGEMEVWHLTPLRDLSHDMRRILWVQISELVNEIEDCELESNSLASVESVQYLKNCRHAA